MPRASTDRSSWLTPSSRANRSESTTRFQLKILKTPGSDLGIDVSSSLGAQWTTRGIFVTRVTPNGYVAKWNQESEEPYRLRPGDFIVQVNNAQGDGMTLVREIWVKQRLTLHVVRSHHTMDMLEDLGGPDTGMPSDLEATRIIPPAPASLPLPRSLGGLESDGRSSGGEGEEESDDSSSGGGEGEEEPGGSSSRGEQDHRPQLLSPDEPLPRQLPEEPCQLLPHVEVLLANISALSDDALKTLICRILEERPAIQDQLLNLT
uniref:PDZ domain-containing protein n=1 Tax=Alexandrium monilatum TaxID=311494 RepID=A0A7S4Q0H1_9DINO|mmetsp:Transcript_58168/g.180473  ORF Transcript_58168/g.180473 Transcript_58168/m.180473 type:complete len:263 (+) Transcript_58168:18-806(+)